MKKTLLLALFLGLFMAGLSSSAYAYLVDSASDSALNGATVEDFSGVAFGTYQVIELTDLIIDALTGSPTNGLIVPDQDFWAGLTEGRFFNNYRGGISSFDIIFNDEVSAFGLTMGYVNTAWTMSAYDKNGNLIETQSSPATDSFYDGFYGIAAAGIQRVNFSSNPDDSDHVLFDNLHYVADTGNAPVPIPSTIGLLSLGLLGLAGVSRRKK